MSSCRRVLLTVAVWTAVLASSCADDEAKSDRPARKASELDASQSPPERDGGASSAERDAEQSTGPTDASGIPNDGGAQKDSGPDKDEDKDKDEHADAAKPDEFSALPPGIREHGGIVNLVDAAAAAQLETFLTSTEQVHITRRQGLTEPVNMFLQHYTEVYDFLFIFTDHSVPTTTTIGKFEKVNVHAAPGGANELELAASGYRSNGRLKGVVGIQWRATVGPPLSHEITHYWAVGLDTRLGFGVRKVGLDPAHWGFTSVHGQLGGFDGTSLRCQTPAGANPPDCTALENDRIRYVAPSFFPNSNPAANYAPLELYLMGLLPKSDVPSTFQALDDAELVAGSQDPATGTVVLEASGIRTIKFADVLARHGEIRELPASERKFRAGFIVVSAQPASAEVLDDVAEWAAAFGNRGQSQVVDAFETLTGGRATLDTQLGPRRPASDPIPEPRKALTCSVLAQDCPRPELACFGTSVPVCALSGRVAKGATCDSVYACEPGLDCFSSPSAPDTYACTPYCEPDSTGPKACQALCSGGTFVRLRNAQMMTTGAFCAP